MGILMCAYELVLVFLCVDQYSDVYINSNNEHAYAGATDSITHIRVLLALSAPQHLGPM